MRVFPICALALLAACGERAPQGSFRERVWSGPLTGAEAEKVRRETPLAGLTEACAGRLRAGGLQALDSVPLHECFDSTPRRRWRGLWRDDFEGSRFCAAPASECSDGTGGEKVWLNVPQGSDAGRQPGIGGLYAVDFIGRRTIHPGLFGHFGMFSHEMTVERMISIREVDPPAPPLTQAEIEAERLRCEAAPNCLTPREMNALEKAAQPR